ncbi:MAG: hypothetical protein COX19_11740 [Desulfobacterales bacterium CG23_combo_of_CG06-09_8_20_14_all_51_8]|nr:MAG: hypothetical protein COX19_11740 [Desulfobacterales bacterium CG23_combo_of_CG06-09_8_20_14_all_51_8]
MGSPPQIIQTDGFRELTWADLNLWAGKNIVSQGRDCYLRKEVRELAMTPSGSILAWVEAEELFATQVEYADGELYSECTCQPVENTCIHAIAVIIEFIVHLKKKIDVPMAPSNDRRFFLL